MSGRNEHASHAAPATLDGLRVLVVEDESIVAMLIEDMLIDFGCSVAAIAANIEDAETRASANGLDAAILDVNVRGRTSFGVAALLRARGIPFAFATGYGVAGIPAELSGVPVLAKPFQQRSLRDVLVRLVTPAAPPATPS